jgi:L-arabinokinase
MAPSYRIVFYISGHGFGHASRSREVIRALLERRPDVDVLVKTSAPRHLFHASAASGFSRAFDFIPFEADTGMVQLDSLRLDEAESLRRASVFHAALPQKAAAEAAFLNEYRAQLVVGDIPPLAFAAAAAAGVPSVAIGNFTWDWIYAGYPEAPDALIHAIQDAYAQASLVLRLPMSGGFDGLQSITRDLPLIARTSHRDPADMRRLLGVPADMPMVLTSFGAYGLQNFDVAGLERLHGYTVITDELPERGPEQPFDYQDLVRAADVVVTKPGYGIISECIANHTAMLYTSRGRFPEYEVLVREMPKYLRVQFIAQEDLLAARWAPSLERLLALPPPPIVPAVNGADVAAEFISRALDAVR